MPDEKRSRNLCTSICGVWLAISGWTPSIWYLPCGGSLASHSCFQYQSTEKFRDLSHGRFLAFFRIDAGARGTYFIGSAQVDVGVSDDKDKMILQIVFSSTSPISISNNLSDKKRFSRSLKWWMFLATIFMTTQYWTVHVYPNVMEKSKTAKNGQRRSDPGPIALRRTVAATWGKRHSMEKRLAWRIVCRS